MKIEGAGINVGRLFLYVEVVNPLILLVSISLPKWDFIVDIDFLCEIENRIILKGLLYYIISSMLLLRSMSLACLR